MTDALWTEASRDIEAEQSDLAMMRLKTRTATLWPFYSLAKSASELEHRIALTHDRLIEMVGEDQVEIAKNAVREDFTIYTTGEFTPFEKKDDDSDDKSEKSDSKDDDDSDKDDSDSKDDKDDDDSDSKSFWDNLDTSEDEDDEKDSEKKDGDSDSKDHDSSSDEDDDEDKDDDGLKKNPFDKSAALEFYHAGLGKWVAVGPAKPVDPTQFKMPPAPSSAGGDSTNTGKAVNENYFDSGQERGPLTGDSAVFPQDPQSGVHNPLNDQYPARPGQFGNWEVPPDKAWREYPMNFDAPSPRREVQARSNGYEHEGVETGTGANSDYFQGGQEGVAGDQQSGFAVYPEVDEDNRLNEIYGQPPQQSSGSGEGQSQGYSNPEVKKQSTNMYDPHEDWARDKGDRSWMSNLEDHEIKHTLQNWSKPTDHPIYKELKQEHDRRGLGGGEARAAVRHTAPGGGEHAPYRVEKGDGGYYVVNEKGERKNKEPHGSEDEARKHQKALFSNVPGASKSATTMEAPAGHDSYHVVDPEWHMHSTHASYEDARANQPKGHHVIYDPSDSMVHMVLAAGPQLQNPGGVPGGGGPTPGGSAGGGGGAGGAGGQAPPPPPTMAPGGPGQGGGAGAGGAGAGGPAGAGGAGGGATTPPRQIPGGGGPAGAPPAGGQGPGTNAPQPGASPAGGGNVNSPTPGAPGGNSAMGNEPSGSDAASKQSALYHFADGLNRNQPTDSQPTGLSDEYSDRTFDGPMNSRPRQPVDHRNVNTPQQPSEPMSQNSSSSMPTSSEDQKQTVMGAVHAALQIVKGM